MISKKLIIAETERLYLRRLKEDELPRMVSLLGDWDVVRYLAVVPFPYTVKDAESFYQENLKYYEQHIPQLFVIAPKTDHLMIGAVGLHPPRTATSVLGEVEVGYWLGREWWGQGFMSEAVTKVLDIGFNRPATNLIGATTALNNVASQRVLTKVGLRNLGEMPRRYPALRGENTVLRWEVTRSEYKEKNHAISL